MKYRKTIIKCENFEESIRLQKYLFKLKYSWRDDGNKHRHIKKISGISYIVINNDDILLMGINFSRRHVRQYDVVEINFSRRHVRQVRQYDVVDYSFLEKKELRKQKLIKLKNYG